MNLTFLDISFNYIKIHDALNIVIIWKSNKVKLD